jgi:hypothetical protein
LTWPGFKPTIYHIWGEHANHNTTDGFKSVYKCDKKCCIQMWQKMSVYKCDKKCLYTNVTKMSVYKCDKKCLYTNVTKNVCIQMWQKMSDAWLYSSPLIR